MSDRIYAALDDDFQRRMRNWARWKDGAPIAISGVNYIQDRWRESTIPVLPGEGEDTDRALRAVPPRERQCVERFWMHEGMSLRAQARHRRVDHHTFEAWVIRGHELLKAELARHAERVRARYYHLQYIGTEQV